MESGVLENPNRLYEYCYIVPRCYDRSVLHTGRKERVTRRVGVGGDPENLYLAFLHNKPDPLVRKLFL